MAKQIKNVVVVGAQNAHPNKCAYTGWFNYNLSQAWNED